MSKYKTTDARERTNVTHIVEEVEASKKTQRAIDSIKDKIYYEDYYKSKVKKKSKKKIAKMKKEILK